MKVAIIGAGTCGLYLGWKLSQIGEEIVIFEKKNKIGTETCSGLFSKRILDFIPESEELIENKIKSALIHFPQKTIKIGFSRDFYVMSHYKLDELLFFLAQKSGAKIILNKEIKEIPKNFDRIIGCDGANSFIRRKLGIIEPDFRLGIQGFIKEQSKKDFVETWPVEKGFLWKIPRKKEVEYGIISSPKKALKIFKNFLEEKNIIVENVKSRIIPSPSQLFEKKLGGQATLCGDAAGLTKPWSGGGVIWGLTAADILLKSFPDFSKYQRKTKSFFGFKINRSKLAVKLVYFLGYKMPWLLPSKVKIESDFLL